MRRSIFISRKAIKLEHSDQRHWFWVFCFTFINTTRDTIRYDGIDILYCAEARSNNYSVKAATTIPALHLHRPQCSLQTQSCRNVPFSCSPPAAMSDGLA